MNLGGQQFRQTRNDGQRALSVLVATGDLSKASRRGEASTCAGGGAAL